MVEILLDIEPMGAVRVTSKGKFSERAVKYHHWMATVKWLWVKECLDRGYSKNFVLPGVIEYIEFGLSINDPDKKGNKGAVHLVGKPYMKKPDLDNLYKAFIDAVCYKGDDSHIWCVNGMRKVYSNYGKGYIFVKFKNEE